MSFATDIETSFSAPPRFANGGRGRFVGFSRVLYAESNREKERGTILRGQQRANKKLVKTGGEALCDTQQ